MGPAKVYRLEVSERERELLLDGLADMDLDLFYGEGVGDEGVEVDAVEAEVKDLEDRIEGAEPVQT